MPKMSVNQLVKQRGTLKCKLTNFKTFITPYRSIPELSDVQASEIECRLSKIEEMYTVFDELQEQIEVSSEEPDEQYVERTSFENQYFAIMASARDLLRKYGMANSKVMSEAGSSSYQRKNNLVRLPKIDLPHFNGNYQYFLEFRDTFLSLIHNNDSIDNINKFHYLRSSLQGSAALVIKSLDFKADNYNAAWELLLSRYDNKRLLVNNHVKALFNVEQIHKESHRALRHLLDITNKNLRALTTLKKPTSHWDTLVIFMMSSKLDSITSREWEEFRNTLDEPPTLDQFTNFISNRADLLETLEESKSGQIKSNNQLHNKQKNFLVANETFKSNKPKYTCPMCKQNHFLFSCDSFRKLSVSLRQKKVDELDVCQLCLRPGHRVAKCKLTTCKYCSDRHNTLLHSETTNASEEVAAVSADENAFIQQPSVLLSTAMVRVSDAKGVQHVVRVLLDNGSTTNFVTEKLRSKLQLPLSYTSSTVTGINNSFSKSNQSCNLTIHSVAGEYKTQLRCLVLPEITKLLPSSYINTKGLHIPSHIQLSDPTFNIPSVIDIFVGAETFWDVIGFSRINLGKHQPILYDSKLGWIISGLVLSSQKHHTVCHMSELLDDDVERQLTRFWELDSVLPIHNFTPEERECEEHFLKNSKRSADGRFIVSMPLKESPKVLGDSYDMAMCRFLALEKRLKNDHDFRKSYNAFMTEYLDLGHMTLSSRQSNNVECLLPHHGVVKESSLTTKLRVVFDASAPTKSGVSLNGIQRIGPTVQDDLISILLRYRQHKYVISGDVEKMYRQMLIAPEQRCLQQILWRFNPTDRLERYMLNTLTYGTASAAYLATRCLKQLGLESADPIIQRAIIHDFYVDDYLSGSDSVDNVIQLGKGVIDTLSSAKLNLRKLRSNNTETLRALLQHTNINKSSQNNTQDSSNLNIQNLSTSAPAKTLGLNWQCDTDVLFFNINLKGSNKVTKRYVLSSIAQVFDPLGLVGPCIVEAKIIMQQLWQQKCSWDDKIPSTLNAQWFKFQTTLPFLNEIKIPRCVFGDCINEVELHIFTDASESAYGTCAYIRSRDDSGMVTVRLLASKNKISPIKATTIPRLELSGVLLGARLFTKILSSLTIKFSSCTFWCDSMIVLGWLASSPANLKPFVRNRVSEVQDVTAGHKWRYVSSKHNPADLVSRGMNARLLASSELWWTGPDFLKQDLTSWPKSKSLLSADLPEMVPCLVVDTQESFLSSLIDRISKFTTLVGVIAYVKRFINNCLKNKMSGFLQSSELTSARKTALCLGQMEMFEVEYSILKSGKTLPSKNRLLSLTPYIDGDNLLKVGGRLDNTCYSDDIKHPVIICCKHRLTKLIFRYFHSQFLHAGPQLLLNTVKQLYWPLGGRNLARKIVVNCVKCCRFKGQTVQPIMGKLPAARAELDYVFANTGTDYAGPILIADRKGRGCKLIKAWICIYVCFAVKAVHLELVSDLTKDAFIASLDRFIARRGKPKNIYCDNATYYTGTCNELYRVLQSSDIASDLALTEINFVFSPPYSPHFGSLWERCVRSVKHHLRRILNLTHLTFEEMSTCLSQIEAVLNSRPLTPMSSDPSDLTALTPAHFLIGRPLMFVPNSQDPVPEDKIKSLQRFRRAEQLKLHFWNRFKLEYVSQLQQKTKWFSSRDKLTEGALVIIKEKGVPPLMWLLGRIEKLYPGKDGIARVADIKTRKGTIQRAFNNICPLPTNI